MSNLKAQLIELLKSGDPEVMEALSDGINEFAEQEPENAYRLFGGLLRVEQAHNRHRCLVMERDACPQTAAQSTMLE